MYIDPNAVTFNTFINAVISSAFNFSIIFFTCATISFLLNPVFSAIILMKNPVPGSQQFLFHVLRVLLFKFHAINKEGYIKHHAKKYKIEL